MFKIIFLFLLAIATNGYTSSYMFKECEVRTEDTDPLLRNLACAVDFDNLFEEERKDILCKLPVAYQVTREISEDLLKFFPKSKILGAYEEKIGVDVAKIAAMKNGIWGLIIEIEEESVLDQIESEFKAVQTNPHQEDSDSHRENPAINPLIKALSGAIDFDKLQQPEKRGVLSCVEIQHLAQGVNYLMQHTEKQKQEKLGHRITSFFKDTEQGINDDLRILALKKGLRKIAIKHSFEKILDGLGIKASNKTELTSALNKMFS